ncbi:GNAT family N-acetyltransferase [Streptomyces clavuligerus]|uniref:GNAT family N-acetyltransferase n=1 Tax=Streptomyces clavuligerus TaxID=1901 RepID=UPI0008107408|nr:GNAT family N-acetyltransferase [Streptomyces clavuligerus]ANW17075.1 GCN5 family acetyltransferase [Streptomyces clavuligerus]AXU11612.1 GNAT family N-acetyltransferase [Streptomyces clavuligerus]MBY6301440.1 GNAT family N-acetyltransferase [Streptomyces clavuligerus]QPL61730.1 GNAT family N-acetyltransferase [Streptomyces clavuligerus]QPL67763.1 GNAT family N-acetyltransferase [Streptomyces clavuligerus]
MKIDEVPWNDPGATALRERQRAEVAAVYGSPESEPGPAPSAADVLAFYVTYGGDGAAMGCGGLRDLGEGAGEIKRMYVSPDHRGSGAAGLILRTLEERARAEGWTRLRVETGGLLTAAIRCYTRSGYVPIPNFGPYAGAADSHCFERTL